METGVVPRAPHEPAPSGDGIAASTALLVVLAGILAMVALVALAAFAIVLPKPLEAPVKVTKTAEGELRKAAMQWRGKHGVDACPTPQQLMDDSAIDPASKLTDAWGSPFQIWCTSDETTVTSFGPDRVRSADDIVSPSRGSPR